MTPYIPTVLLPRRPHLSPAAILYHALSTYDVTGKRQPLHHHTPRNLPWFSSFTERLLACCLYASAPSCPHMNPGLHITPLVLFRLVWNPTLSDILTIVVSAACTNIRYRPNIRPSSAYKHMLCFPADHPIPCWDSRSPQISRLLSECNQV